MDKKDKNDYYKVEIRCTNCKQRYTIEIKKGVTAEDALKNDPCNKCGCCKLVLY
jgi:hypothetical protein